MAVDVETIFPLSPVYVVWPRGARRKPGCLITHLSDNRPHILDFDIDDLFRSFQQIRKLKRHILIYQRYPR